MSFRTNAPQHQDNDKCPACSSEIDKGGRLILKPSNYKTFNGHRQFYLKCSLCKYRITNWGVKENSYSPVVRLELTKALWQQAKRNTNPA